MNATLLVKIVTKFNNCCHFGVWLNTTPVGINYTLTTLINLMPTGYHAVRVQRKMRAQFIFFELDKQFRVLGRLAVCLIDIVYLFTVKGFLKSWSFYPSPTYPFTPMKTIKLLGTRVIVWKYRTIVSNLNNRKLQSKQFSYI